MKEKGKALEAKPTVEGKTQAPRIGTLRNGGRAAPMTEETRQKGIEARRANARKRRERAVEVFESKAVKALKRAAEVYVEGMEAGTKEKPDHQTRIAAADRMVERVLGKPLARSESTVSAHVEVDIEAKLLALLARSGTDAEPST